MSLEDLAEIRNLMDGISQIIRTENPNMDNIQEVYGMWQVAKTNPYYHDYMRNRQRLLTAIKSFVDPIYELPRRPRNPTRAGLGRKRRPRR